MTTSMRKHVNLGYYSILTVVLAIGISIQSVNAREGVSVSDSPASVTSISSEDLTKWNVSRDISDYLSTPSRGTIPSGSAEIRIRGLTSEKSSSLVLVNGVRVFTSIDDINPADIARVDVIKGASATAIYGSDAVAGVINVITKRPREESSGSFINPDSSVYSGDAYQTGHRAMASARVDPVGEGLAAFYSSGGNIGSDAGDMFTSAVRLRQGLGGPLCDLGTTESYQWQWPSEDAANCLADEMLGYQASYDNNRGVITPDQLGGEYIYTGLTGLGFGSSLSYNIANSRFPQFSASTLRSSSEYGFHDYFPRTTGAYVSDFGNVGYDWNDLTDLKMNPALQEHFLNYSSSRKNVIPSRDLNPFTLDAVYGESNFGRQYYETVKPNDPLYKKPDTAGRKLGGALKKGFGALLSISGVGIGTTNNDSRSEDQWGLHAVGYTPMGMGTSAWDVIDGREENVVVAVIDSGLDLNHPDRPKYIWRNQTEIPDNNIDDDTNGYVDDIHGWNFLAESNNIDDDYGHGTFVAGIIAANTDNGIGIAGINPGARIMALKVGGQEGKPRSLAIYRAIRYAVDNGARVINISLGSKGLSRLEQIGINYAYAMGCVVVNAAGNEGGDIAQFGPAGARRVFSVSSLNIDGSRRSQSNKGLMVAVAAPGESIYSLTAQNGKRDGRIIPMMAGEYHRLNGTSFAAPIVAGTASLLMAKNPNLSNYEVEDILLASALDAEEPGWDAKTGMGKLNARYALTMQPETAFAPRITEWIINKDKHGKISSVDVYGVIRGPLESYELAIGQGKNPSVWTSVYGPANRMVQHGHIARLPGNYFKKGSSWSIQLNATAIDGQRRTQKVVVQKKR